MQAFFMMTRGPEDYCAGYLETVPLRDPPEVRCQTIGEVYEVTAGYQRGRRLGSLVPGTELSERTDTGQLTLWPAQGAASPYVTLAVTLDPLDDYPEWYSGRWRNPREAQAGGWVMLRRIAQPLRYPADELDDPQLLQMLVQYLAAEIRYQQQAA